MPVSGKPKTLPLLALLAAIVAIGISLYGFLAPRGMTEDAAFGDRVKAYLMENPGVLREALITLSQREKQAAAEQQQALLTTYSDDLQNDGYSFVAGNPEGDVTIVEFFDYRCGYCKKSFPDLMKAVQEDGNTRLVLKEFPILGAESFLASQAAIAALEQGKYEVFHAALMESHGSLTKERILSIAEQSGLDTNKLQADMQSDKTREVIEKNHELAGKLGISGTPAFIIGDQFIPGVISLEDMKTVINAVRAQAKAAGNAADKSDS
jgi:protein-disulfide isomerase|tara:strand:- start:58 stop:855 length:798 start_codon:yes stop_codon:yes gene_type:complete